jgi:hypothetical protein
VIITSNIGGPGHVPARAAGARLLASLDVEWQKNYRIKNGNRAFCYSVTWITLPNDAAGTDMVSFAYTSVYLDPTDEPAQLVALADVDLRAMLKEADIIAGHQLCSDLAVLAANANGPSAHVEQARQTWHQRRELPITSRRLIDTRFDVDHLPLSRSRRLVDVCTELGLDVTQPELARKSMTALHRDWLSDDDVEARERISILNLRHSLSTAYVALRAAGQVDWPAPVNVNRLLDRDLTGSFGWLDSPTFRSLV